MLKITALPANRLTSAQVEAWSVLQQALPAFDSPYFRPEFTLAVAAVRPDVEVGVLEDGGGVVGFFPFQRGAWGIAGPVGGKLSDFQAVVVRPDATWTPEEILRGCGLVAWDFDHLLASQQPFHRHFYLTSPSPYLDLSDGFEAYCAARALDGSELVKQVFRKRRKAEREVGPVRLEPHTPDRQVLKTLLRWKSEQYQQSQATDVFAFPWTVQLLERILEHTGPAFAGMQSALYIGGELAAVHLGLRSRGILHSWFPVFNRDLGRYSPGLILFLELARACPGLGVRRLDLGRGSMAYKTGLMTGATLVAEGCAARAPLVRLVRRGWHHTRTWVKGSPLRAPARVAGRLTRPLRGWLAFR